MTQAELEFLVRTPRLLKQLVEEIKKMNENLEKIANKENSNKD